jgi:hypothetical protein
MRYFFAFFSKFTLHLYSKVSKPSIYFIKQAYTPIMGVMKVNGWTVSELVAELNISADAVRKRIETAGLKPYTREAIWPPETLEIIREIKMGRPAAKSRSKKSEK